MLSIVVVAAVVVVAVVVATQLLLLPLLRVFDQVRPAKQPNHTISIHERNTMQNPWDGHTARKVDLDGAIFPGCFWGSGAIPFWPGMRVMCCVCTRVFV